MQIAVLSGDPAQGALICHALSNAGHGCVQFSAGKDVLAELRRQPVDMLLLDWQTEDDSAPEVLRWTRDRLPAQTPVMFLTGRDGENDIIAALAGGANDYIVKPVRRGELLLRVRAQLQRAYPSQAAPEQIRFDEYVFEIPTGRLSVSGMPVDVTQKEFELALLLFQNLGRPLSRATIQEAIWARDSDLPSRTMDTHISRVRNKLRLKPENGFRLTPVYSYGYRLEQLPKQTT